MTDLVVSKQDNLPTLPAYFRMPHINDGLDYLVWNVLHPHPDVRRQKITELGRKAASEALAEHLPMMEPASPDLIAAFLWPVAGGVRNPPAEAEFRRRVVSIGIAAWDLPHVAWTKRSQREGLGIWQFMPSAADVVQVVSKDVQPLIERVRALKMIAHTGSLCA